MANDELKEVFPTEEELKQAQEQSEKEEIVKESEKEDDIRAINKEAETLEKEFEKENKEKLEQLKKEEKAREKAKKEAEQAKKEGKTDEKVGQTSVKSDEKHAQSQDPKQSESKQTEQKTEEKTKKPTKSAITQLLQFMAIPLILLGGAILWNAMFGEIADVPKFILFVLAIGIYAITVKMVIHSFKYDVKKRQKVGKCLLATLLVAIVVLLMVFRSEISQYLLMILGTAIVIIAFVSLILVVGKIAEKQNKKLSILHIVLTSMTFVVGVLFIVSHFVFAIEYYVVMGAVSCVFGSTLFSA